MTNEEMMDGLRQVASVGSEFLTQDDIKALAQKAIDRLKSTQGNHQLLVHSLRGWKKILLNDPVGEVLLNDAIAALDAAPEREKCAVKNYGYCPRCGAEAVKRERRPNGNDTCANGCNYPSKETLNAPNEQPANPSALADEVVGYLSHCGNHLDHDLDTSIMAELLVRCAAALRSQPFDVLQHLRDGGEICTPDVEGTYWWLDKEADLMAYKGPSVSSIGEHVFSILVEHDNWQPYEEPAPALDTDVQQALETLARIDAGIDRTIPLDQLIKELGIQQPGEA